MIDLGARHEALHAPWSLGFNAMTKTMATLANPRGWRLEPSYALVPRSIPDLNNSVNTSGQVAVWSGIDRLNRPLVFGCKEHAQAFDAWVSATRWANSLPETVAGYAACAYLMIQAMVKEYGSDEEVETWASMILALVLDPAVHNVLHGYRTLEAPVLKAEDLYSRLGAALACHLSDVTMTKRQVVAYAATEWGRA